MVNKFVEKVNEDLRAIYKTTHERFSLCEAKVEERMMRIGIEARMTGAKTVDEFRSLAIATLKQDFIKHHKPA